MAKGMEKGSRVGSWVVEDVHPLEEFRGEGRLFFHEKSGCRAYHVSCPDPDNLFAFAFRTIPVDSTGVAHILEHTVLCGSRSFPVKDPFLLLLKGSMNTFLNAFTFPDKTVYPGSSTVPKDFFHLMEVYGDAVFHPLLKEAMFRQEGHRLEFDAEGRMIRTGIVYNEMKGNYSTHDSVAGDWCFRSLFPDTPYGNDSGGDPACIPDLDYPAFKAFHERFYHPSNTLVFLYGDIPSEESLEFLDRRFLQEFNAAPVDARLEEPAPWTEPRTLVRTYPSGDDDEATVSVTLNWLLPGVEDPLTVLSHEVLADLLLGSSASPLQRALVDSGLGEDLSPVAGLETELSRMIFSAGLRGTRADRADAIADLVMDTLSAIGKEGFHEDLVEGTLRRYEFRSREIKGGGPFGLRLMRRSLRSWLHGGRPESSMIFAPVMEQLRKELAANPRYFEDLVVRDLLDNPHRSLVTIIPDPEQNAREAAVEAEQVEKARIAMGPGGEEAVRRSQAELEAIQSGADDPAALATIPFLKEEDIPVKVTVIPAMDRVLTLGDHLVPVQVHDIHSNGICYVDLIFDLEHLDQDSLMYLPLFSSMVPSLGLPGTDFEEMARRLNLHTGGFSSGVEAGLHVRSSLRDPEDLHLKLHFRLRCLEESLPQAMDLAGSLIRSADFGDTKRIADLFLETRNEFRSSLIPSGSSYAALRTERSFSSSEEQEEAWRGISQLEFLESLGAEPRDAAECLAKAFGDIRDQVIRASCLTVNITAGGNAVEAVLQQVARWAAVLPLTPPESRTAEPSVSGQPRLEALLLATKVNFAALSVRGSLMGSRTYAQEVLLAHLLRTGSLWEKIRMKGGAYGANAGIDGMAGIFSFTSYRDPQAWQTLESFREALEEVARDGFGQEDMLLAKIGSVAREIRPLSPAEAGSVAFRRWLYGIGDDLRQARRNDLLALESDDLRQAARRLLDAWNQGYSALITSAETVDKEERDHPGFRPVRHPVSS